MRIIRPADILLPRVRSMGSWRVVACDQFTSQPDYWEEAEKLAGENPSALRMILPEAWLGTPREKDAEARIEENMSEYISDGLFQTYPQCFVYLERTQSDGRVRRGLMAALDLEQYDFTPGNRAPVRATEGTVEERLPPRIRIRASAPLEMPHVMVLMDDRADRVIGPLENAGYRMKKLYDFDLMLKGGHVTGWLVTGPLLETALSALDSLSDEELLREKYGSAAENGPLVFAVGDGNHSLAAAKRYWEQLREELSEQERETHPARFSLVELVNIHETALDFEPIHRVIFDTDTGNWKDEYERYRSGWEDTGRTIGERVSAGGEKRPVLFGSRGRGSSAKELFHGTGGGQAVLSGMQEDTEGLSYALP